MWIVEFKKPGSETSNIVSSAQKNRCLIGSHFKFTKEDKKTRLKGVYEQHIRSKYEANACKEEDKKRTSQDNTFVST